MMSREVEDWLFDDGDIPSFRWLPQHSPRVAEFQANAPHGLVARIRQTACRIASVFRPDNAAEVERLRKMIRETLE
jgi:hypothetical protein